ncbi:hypothetical protein ACFS27_04935 [Promicromonospora vindobonensis]|uniref:Uncharacterized protein n=1 Tax=Promicromonospora vindobonensis TaxID=195748 RepID=A0ABW5VR79_9MICO
MTHLLESGPLGWVFIAVGAISSVRWWHHVWTYTTKALPRPGGKTALAVEGAMLALVWLIGGAVVVYPIVPMASIGMVVVAAYCFPVAFVGTGLLAFFRVDELIAWMGWPRPEGRWRRGVIRGVGVAHAVAGLAIAVLVTYALLRVSTGA